MITSDVCYEVSAALLESVCPELVLANPIVGGLACAGLGIGAALNCAVLEKQMEKLWSFLCDNSKLCVMTDSNPVVPTLAGPAPRAVGGSTLWPYKSFDFTATLSSDVTPILGGAPTTGSLSVHVDVSLLMWAETYTNGTATVSTVQQCAYASMDKQYVLGTTFRQFPNGTCFSYPSVQCTVLTGSYLQTQLLTFANLSESNFTAISNGTDGKIVYSTTAALSPNFTASFTTSASSSYPLSFVVVVPSSQQPPLGDRDSNANSNVTLIDVEFTKFVPRSVNGSDPSPFHPPWLSSCVPSPWR